MKSALTLREQVALELVAIERDFQATKRRRIARARRGNQPPTRDQLAEWFREPQPGRRQREAERLKRLREAW